MDNHLRDLVRQYTAEPTTELAFAIANFVSRTSTQSKPRALAIGIGDAGFSANLVEPNASQDEIAGEVCGHAGLLFENILLVVTEEQGPQIVKSWETNYTSEYQYIAQVDETLGIRGDYQTNFNDQLIIYTDVYQGHEHPGIQRFSQFGQVEDDGNGQYIIYTNLRRVHAEDGTYLIPFVDVDS